MAMIFYSSCEESESDESIEYNADVILKRLKTCNKELGPNESEFKETATTSEIVPNTYKNDQTKSLSENTLNETTNTDDGTGVDVNLNSEIKYCSQFERTIRYLESDTASDYTEPRSMDSSDSMSSSSSKLNRIHCGLSSKNRTGYGDLSQAILYSEMQGMGDPYPPQIGLKLPYKNANEETDSRILQVKNIYDGISNGFSKYRKEQNEDTYDTAQQCVETENESAPSTTQLFGLGDKHIGDTNGATMLDIPQGNATDLSNKSTSHVELTGKESSVSVSSCYVSDTKAEQLYSSELDENADIDTSNDIESLQGEKEECSWVSDSGSSIYCDEYTDKTEDNNLKQKLKRIIPINKGTGRQHDNTKEPSESRLIDYDEERERRRYLEERLVNLHEDLTRLRKELAEAKEKYIVESKFIQVASKELEDSQNRAIKYYQNGAEIPKIDLGRIEEELRGRFSATRLTKALEFGNRLVQVEAECSRELGKLEEAMERLDSLSRMVSYWPNSTDHKFSQLMSSRTQSGVLMEITRSVDLKSSEQDSVNTSYS